jgi:hypothetical protein
MLRPLLPVWVKILTDKKYGGLAVDSSKLLLEILRRGADCAPLFLWFGQNQFWPNFCFEGNFRNHFKSPMVNIIIPIEQDPSVANQGNQLSQNVLILDKPNGESPVF